MSARSIVLLGMGHTHLYVLKKWASAPIPGTRLLCISDSLYSVAAEMLPGVLAGNYRSVDSQVDWPTIADRVGAQWRVAEVIGHDPMKRTLQFKNRKPLPYDVLSIGIGSVDRGSSELDPGAPVIPVKPLQTFIRRFGSRLADLRAMADKRQLQIVVVGGGVGGAEMTLCAPWFVEYVLRTGNRYGFRKSKLPGVRRGNRSTSAEELPQSANWTIIEVSPEILPGVSTGLRKRISRELDRREVTVRTGVRVEGFSDGCVLLDGEESIPADLVLWCTGPEPPPPLRNLNLPTDEQGFLLTEATLKSTADVPVFAVGDAGTIRGSPNPRSGVNAIREGPILWQNIRRILCGRPLKTFAPHEILKIVNTGRGRAIGELFGFSFEGRWVWKLRGSFDRQFVQQYQGLQHIPPPVDSRPVDSVLD